MYDETRTIFVNKLLPYIMEPSLSIGTRGLRIKLGSINHKLLQHSQLRQKA